MSQPTVLDAFGPAQDAPSGVGYGLALRRPGLSPVVSLFALLLGFSGFALVVPVVAQLVIRVGHLISGGDWAEYVAAASAYELPIGPFSSHLGLAMLIPVSILIVRYLIGVRPRWLASVQPGIRWRYLLVCLVVAVVVLNGALWLSYLVTGMPTFGAGQEGWITFAFLLAVSAPLQAAAEEVFFRGFVLQAIGAASGRQWIGVVGSSLLFALLHGVQNPALFAHRFAFGLVAGTLVVVTGGLEAGIAAHIVNNLGAYGYAMFTMSISQLKAVTEISWGEAAWNIAGYALFGIVAWIVGSRLFRLPTTTP